MRKREQAGTMEKRFSIRRVELDSRLFATVAVGERFASLSKGWFLRVRPTADDSDADIAKYRAVLEAAGAVVRVLPKPRAKVLVEEAAPVPESKGIRETVLAMGAEANTGDKAGLLALLEQTLAVVGQ
jgi:hypothetical protein